jgi:hypothetical protein
VTRRQIPDDHPNVPSLRTLGRAGQQSCAGNDPRLSDARTTVAADDVDIGTRKRLNLAAGTGISLTPLDLPDTDTAQVTITATGGGGTLPDDNYGDVTVSGSGTVITINSPVPPARLGTGTADSSTFLRGDSTFAHIEAVRFPVKNTSGGTLAKGTPVYATGSVGASSTTEISGADASNVNKMPAIGLLETSLANNAQGWAQSLGVLRQLDTSAYSINGTVYVAAGGGLTPTRPSGTSDLVQNIGRVIRVNGSNGEILVLGPGRTNDVPNSIAYTVLPVGTTAGTIAAGDDSRMTNDRTASGLRTASTVVDVSSATAPSAGQVLTATSNTAATWQTPAGGGDDTKFADAENSAKNVASTSNVDLCTKLFTVAAGDTFVIEAFGSLFNNSGGARTYTVQATIAAGVNIMSCSVADGGSIAANGSNRAPHFLRAIISVSSTSSASVLVELSRAVPGAANTGLSTAGTQIRQGWQTSGLNFTGANVSVTLALRSNNATAPQTFHLHSWKIEQTPERL